MEKRRKKRGCLSRLLLMLLILIIFGAGAYAAGALLLQGDGAARQAVEQVIGQVAGRFAGKAEVQKVSYQEIKEVQESAAQKYYYGQLAEDEQKAYLEIAQGVQDMEEEIYLHSSDPERTNELFHYVLKDYPDIFWCDGAASSTAYEGEEPYTVLTPLYECDEAQRQQRQAEIDGAVSECLAGISAEASDYEKILYVYNYIVNTVDYDLEAPYNQNIYSVFANKRSVCAGYSRAAQYLLERLGVFCTYVTGATDTGESHGWNLVMCGGEYYYVDVTWGDPVFQLQEGTETGQLSDSYISYDYMCCNDEELFKTHTPDGDIPLPACTSMACNYYVVNGQYYDTYDGQAALAAMNDTIAAGGNPVVLKYSNADVYWQAHDDIFNNIVEQAAQNLAQWYGLSEVEYSYIDDEKENKIVIYWKYGG